MKKLLVSLLAMSMCLSMLVGCGGDSAADGTASDGVTSGTADGDTMAAGDVEIQDFTILGAHATNALYYDVTEFDDFYSVQALKDLMKDYGLNLEFELVANDQYLTTLQTRFAAMNDIPYYVAMYGMSEAEVMQLAAQGVIIDINPMLERSASAKEFFTEDRFGNTAYRKVCTSDGKMYWLPNIYITKWGDSYGESGTNYGVGIRQDWLNMYGLDMPDTLDEFTKALKTFNEKDPSGTGNANVAGMHVLSTNPCEFGDCTAQWFGLVRGLINNNWDTQQAISPWHQETIKDYLSYIRGLNEAGLYDTEMVGTTDTLTQKYSANYVGAMNVYALGAYEQNIESVFDANAENPVLYMPMKPIQAVEGVQPLLALEDPIYVWDEFCFTSNLTDLDLGARFLEAYYSDEHIDLINFGTEGYNYEMVDGEKVYKQYTASEDGKVYQADQLNQYIEDKAAQKLLFGKHLYSRAITSDYTYYNLDVDAETSLNKGYAAPKYYFQQETLDYGHWTSIDATGVWATADPEDVEEINLVWNDLNSYSKECISALVLGQKSLDEIDTIVAELDALGLNDVEAIRQNQYDRFLGK